MKTDLSILQRYILEIVAVNPINSIKDYALDKGFEYTYFFKNIKTLLEQQYLIKDGETICINGNKPFPKLFNIKGHNDYIQLLESMVIKGNIVKPSELDIIRRHFIN